MRGIRLLTPLLILVLAARPVPASGGREADGEITIDPADGRQIIQCFGASGAWSMDPIGSQWNEEAKQNIAALLFSTTRGIGLSGWKFLIGAGSARTDTAIITPPNEWRRSESFRPREDEGYDWSRQAGQQWFLSAARAHGVQSLHAIAYSPPVWMTKNGHAQPDAASGSTNLPAERFADFAAYLADIAAHFGFTDVFPVNEPTWDWNRASQEANRYTAKEVAELAGLLSRELTTRGISPRIVVPEAGELKALEGFIPGLLGDAARGALIRRTVSAHSYWSDYEGFGARDPSIAMRRRMRAALDSFGTDVAYRQTEYCILGPGGSGRDLGMATAIRVARVIHMDLTLMDAVEWSWWLAVSPYDWKDGLLYTDYRNPGDRQTVTTSKTFWALGNFSRFIRPGFVRVETRGGDDPAGLMASAYRGPGGGPLVIVCVNAGQREAHARLRFPAPAAITGFTPWLTSAADDLRELPRMRADGVVTIPAQSVLTLVSDSR